MAVIGTVSAVIDDGAGRVQEFLGMIDAGDGVERRRGLGVVDFGQAVDLLGTYMNMRCCYLELPVDA